MKKSAKFLKVKYWCNFTTLLEPFSSATPDNCRLTAASKARKN
jgi:hypothetical protein